MEEEIGNGPQRSINTQVSHSGEHKNISKEVKEETSIAHQKQEQHKTKPDDTSKYVYMCIQCILYLHFDELYISPQEIWLIFVSIVHNWIHML